MRVFVSVLLCFVLTACNSIYYKPHTLDRGSMVYVQRGGYSMKRSIKQAMTEHGYNVHVGTLRNEKDSDDLDIQTFDVPRNAKYTVYVKERTEFLRPIWCAFNGFWWWNFNVSITEKSTGHEIMSWRGRGCQNSSIRKLNSILDELEK